MDTKAFGCLRDTLFILLERAQAAKAASLAKDGTSDKYFEAGYAEALIETLHTWANQVKTFELDSELGDVYTRLRAFLTEEGLP